MKKPLVKRTTATNLEAKFNRGEDVLDYFEPGKADSSAPRNRAPAQYIVELSGAEPAIREPSGSYKAKAQSKAAPRARRAP